ncbi:MAG: polysaccharide pyruvyl transferase CsaB [Armatimonadetes bacterium]|nr:polysaccharide pyruvyl transferase CsaB [Armatimonadota bacterium]
MIARKRIIISGYYGFSNMGDEAVLSAIIAGLREHSKKDIEITVISGAPKETQLHHGVRSLSRRSIAEVLTAIRESDLVISGGGSLIQDATSFRSLLYYLWVIMQAQRSRRKVMILGQGIGPLRRKISCMLARRVLDRVDIIAVRDPDSANLLKKIGVARPPIYVTADPAFLLKAEPTEQFEGDIITFALREWREAPWVEQYAIESLKQLSKELPAKIFLMAMHTPGDLEMASRIGRQVGDSVIVQKENLTPEQLLGIICASKMVVSMRLHALIFAAASGIPMLGITYDPKVESFLKSVGQENMSLEDLKSGKLPRRVLDTWHKRDVLSARLAEKVPAFKDAAKENIRLALELLE